MEHGKNVIRNKKYSSTTIAHCTKLSFRELLLRRRRRLSEGEKRKKSCAAEEKSFVVDDSDENAMCIVSGRETIKYETRTSSRSFIHETHICHLDGGMITNSCNFTSTQVLHEYVQYTAYTYGYCRKASTLLMRRCNGGKKSVKENFLTAIYTTKLADFVFFLCSHFLLIHAWHHKNVFRKQESFHMTLSGNMKKG